MSLFHFFRFRRLLLVVFVLLVAMSLVTCVYSEDGPILEVKEGTEEIPLKFEENGPPIEFNLHLEENSREFDAHVKVNALDLWDRERSRLISGRLINFTLDGTDAKTGFTVNKSSSVEVTVRFDPKGIEPGTYTGKIVISYGNTSDNLTSDIIIPLKIQIGKPIIWPIGMLVIGVVIGAAVNFAGVQLGKRKSSDKPTYFSFNHIKANPGPLIIGGIVAFIFILMSIIGYYPKIADFGADWIDYAHAIIFGLGEYGTGKLTTDAISRALGNG